MIMIIIHERKDQYDFSGHRGPVRNYRKTSITSWHFTNIPLVDSRCEILPAKYQRYQKDRSTHVKRNNKS